MIRGIDAERACLIIAIVAGCLLRLIAVQNNAPIEVDGIQYAKVAEAYSEGRFSEGMHTVFPPGYPLFVALFHLAVQDVELAGRLVSVVFGTLLIYLSFLLGRKVLQDDRKAVALSFLVAFQPFLIRYSGQVLSESLATFLFTLTIYWFYVGWRENRRSFLFFCGFSLLMTYLTRCEYLIFFIPLLAVLFRDRRFAGGLLMLLPPFVLGALYVLYLHFLTGLWVISNRAMLSPFVPLLDSLINLPRVVYYFVVALAPPYFVLTVFGFGRSNVFYRNLLLFLVIFHIASLSFIANWTQRYSVEFVPLCLVFAANGAYGAGEYLGRFVKKRYVYLGMALVVAAASLFHAYTPGRPDRMLLKDAGLFLASRDPGSIVAARLPLVAFYGRGGAVDLLFEITGKHTAEEVLQRLKEKRVKYMIIDEEILKEAPFLAHYLSGRSPLLALGDKLTFVRIYPVF